MLRDKVLWSSLQSHIAEPLNEIKRPLKGNILSYKNEANKGTNGRTAR